MDLMSIRSDSYFNASMVSKRADHLFIHNYIELLLNNKTYCIMPEGD